MWGTEGDGAAQARKALGARMGTSMWPVFMSCEFHLNKLFFLRDNPSWIFSRNSINRLLNVWNKFLRTTHTTLKEEHRGGAGLRGGETLAGGDGSFQPRHRHSGRTEAKASTRRVQAGGAAPESGAAVGWAQGSGGTCPRWGGGACAQSKGGQGPAGLLEGCSYVAAREASKENGHPGRGPAGDVPGAPLGLAGAKL